MKNFWNMDGHYLESCSCKGACPCLLLGSPTEGSCTALVGWHISKGQFGDTTLDGLNVVVALRSPGDMADGNWKVVLYIDQAADENQRSALMGVFGGECGGHPAVLASFIGEVLGVEYLPIRYQANDGYRHFGVGVVAETSIDAMEGQNGNYVSIHNHPLAVAPGEELIVAKSRSLRHDAYGLNFELDGRMAFYSSFSYTSD
ncbi:DUF1326 domain-containing protein [Amphritea balenae]|uniref:DUF1326 domain-containing protein n=1 Tax=Amphritea balenae TaxID=452629 RepID=A0A3P1SSZ9_9GAMM|nr:DUF1326 domain-containing protein [Amphritea balenae]RRC99302.1 DUF1326 domain-containing protein [Amphritea balenae]GGK72195.1 hypothetical protein GCM10007941_22800 [Amphritea balenae]